jgi:glycosyltransferase involved in cell wall biosynthesis
MRKTVLVITPTFFPVMGGAERGIYEIYRRLERQYDVHILAPRLAGHDGPIWPQGVAPANFTLHGYSDEINLLKVKGQRLLLGALPPFSISMAQAASRLVRQVKPDIANVHYAIPSGLAVFTLRRRRIPVLLSLVGRDLPGPGTLPLWPHYIQRVARCASAAVCISHDSSKSLLDATRGGWEQKRVIPYGVTIPSETQQADITELRESLKIPQQSVILFALQRLDKVKRLDVLLESLRLILQSGNDVFLVVGGTGPEMDYLKHYAAKLGVSSNVLFVGFIKDDRLPKYYAMADIFLFHSTFETFGVSVAEAMAAQKPIIAADNTAVPELIKHGETGWLVPPMRPKLLADGILSLLKDGDLATRLAANAFRYVKDNLAWDKVAESYDEALASISS